MSRVESNNKDFADALPIGLSSYIRLRARNPRFRRHHPFGHQLRFQFHKSGQLFIGTDRLAPPTR